MERNELEKEMASLMSHPSVSGVQLGDVFSKTFDFKNDMRIPAVLVCLLADVQFRIWNGTIVNKGLSLLMMRRGFELGALPGVWSMIAGVRDYSSSEGKVSTQKLTIMNALKEVEEETGISASMLEDEVIIMGNFLQPNPTNPQQGFVNVVVCARLKPGLTPGIRLCHEHTGAVWVSIDSIREFQNWSNSLSGRVCTFIGKYFKTIFKFLKINKILQQVLVDGMAPNMEEKVFRMLRHLRSR